MDLNPAVLPRRADGKLEYLIHSANFRDLLRHDDALVVSSWGKTDRLCVGQAGELIAVDTLEVVRLSGELHTTFAHAAAARYLPLHEEA